MWAVAGLGNPGTKYALTRHNIGFMAIDFFAQGVRAPSFQTEHNALTCRFKMEQESIILCKPQTYMNKSGSSVRPLMDFYKISLDNLIVIQDDIDLPFGKMRFHKNRGHGGHNGIRDISSVWASNDYIRLKLGVGRPAIPQMDIADYVLQNFSQEEQNQLPDFLNRAVDAVECLIFEGLQKASSKFNEG